MTATLGGLRPQLLLAEAHKAANTDAREKPTAGQVHDVRAGDTEKCCCLFRQQQGGSSGDSRWRVGVTFLILYRKNASSTSHTCPHEVVRDLWRPWGTKNRIAVSSGWANVKDHNQIP